VGLFVAAYFADESGAVPIWAAIAASIGSYGVFAIFDAAIG
jgi:hypothetical protein